MRFRTSISNYFYREEENQFICSPALQDGLELLSIEHLLFSCNPDSHLALTIFNKTKSVSAHPTLTLEVIEQYKYLLSVKYSIFVYNIMLGLLYQNLFRGYPGVCEDCWEGNSVIKLVFLL